MIYFVKTVLTIRTVYRFCAKLFMVDPMLKMGSRYAGRGHSICHKFFNSVWIPFGETPYDLAKLMQFGETPKGVKVGGFEPLKET